MEKRVLVIQKTEGGLANQRVKEILASCLNMLAEKIILIRGAKQRNKIFKLL